MTKMKNSFAFSVYTVIIGCIVHIDCQSINLCANPVSGQRCDLTCNTTDFNQDIEFLLGSAVQEKCTVIGSVSACGTGMSQSGTITTYTIPSLSRGTHEGDWSCKYGSATSTTQSLVVKTVPTTVQITQSIPDANLTTGIEEVQVTAQCYCIYPSTTDVVVLYKEGTGSFNKLATVPTASISTTLNPGSPCLTDEFKIEITNYTVNPGFNTKKSNVYLKIQFDTYMTGEYGPFDFAGEAVPGEGSTTTESTTINLSTDGETTLNTAMSETSNKMSTGSLSRTYSSVSLFESTPEGNTPSGSTESVGTKSEISTAPVTTSPSGLSEEMIIIISVVSAVGGILLIIIIVIVVLCCKRRTSTANKKNLKNKHDKLYVKTGKNKDLNSNYDQTQKNKYSAQSRRNLQGDTNLYQKHSQKDIFYGCRMPPGAEFPRSQNYYQQNYFSGNQHHYRKKNNVYYLPYTDPRNVMHYQRYPESGYNEDMLGYSRAGPYRMQQFYPKSYARHDSYTDYELERRIGHARGQYESYWDDPLY